MPSLFFPKSPYMKNFIVNLVILLLANVVNGQTIMGTIAGAEKSKVISAVVILQNTDSLMVEATTTDTVGQFVFKNELQSGQILIQHVAYENKIISFTNGDYSQLKQIVLTEKSNQLDDITINAQAHVVKIEGSKIKVNTEKIKERKAVSSAFDVLKYTPGVIVNGDEVKLLGAKQLTLILNGKKTQLSNDDIIEKLKILSAEKVSNIEIMYKAPSKYDVYGAIINIVIDKQQRESPVTAELRSNFEQQYFGYYKASEDIEYQGEKLGLELMLNQRGGGLYTGSSECIEYELNDTKTTIAIDNNNPEDYLSGRLKFGLDYNFSDDIKLSSYYYGKRSIDNYKYRANTNIGLQNNIDTTESDILSRNKKDNIITNHNAYISLDANSLSLSVDYVDYEQEINSNYSETIGTTNTDSYQSTTSQGVDRLQILSNYDIVINDQWEMNVGANATFSKSNTEISYKRPNNSNAFEFDASKYQLNIQKERDFSLFTESYITLFDSLTFDIELKASWFKSDYEHNSQKKALWNNFIVYPSINVMWQLQNSSAFDFTFYMQRHYPSYYSTNTDTTQTSAIVSEVGNPELKPEMEYYTEVTYILNGLYTFGLYGTYSDNPYISAPYIDPQNMQELTQSVNLDYDFEAGVQAYIPFSYGCWDASLTSFLFWHKQYLDDFHGASINQSKLALTLDLSNSFSFFDNKLACNVDAHYKSKDIDGLYKMSNGYGLDLGLRWKILNNLTLTSYWENVFGTYNPNPATMNFNGIKSQYTDKSQECSNFVISLLWRIGNFKPKEMKGGDTGRMGI